jgi:hypothetical protein
MSFRKSCLFGSGIEKVGISCLNKIIFFLYKISVISALVEFSVKIGSGIVKTGCVSMDILLSLIFKFNIQDYLSSLSNKQEEHII